MIENLIFFKEEIKEFNKLKNSDEVNYLVLKLP